MDNRIGGPGSLNQPSNTPPPSQNPPPAKAPAQPAPPAGQQAAPTPTQAQPNSQQAQQILLQGAARQVQSSPATGLSQKSSDAKSSKDTKGERISSGEGEDLGTLFQNVAPHKMVKRLGELLEKSAHDPKVEKMLARFQVPADSKQALALCTYTCIKQLLTEKAQLSSDDEKQLFEAIKQEYEENASQGTLDPDQRKKRKRERRKRSSAKVNAMMILIEDTTQHLEKLKSIESRGLSFES